LTLASLMRLEVAELYIRGVDLMKPEGFSTLQSRPLQCASLDLIIPAAVNGDDLVAYWNSRLNFVSFWFCGILGLRVSDKDFFARTHGIFMEDGFILRLDQDRTKRDAEMPNLVKARFFTTFGRVGGGGQNSNPFIGKTISIFGQVRYIPPEHQAFRDLVLGLYRSAHSISFSVLKHLALEVPPIFGGLSFPNRSLSEVFRTDPNLIRGMYSIVNMDLKDMLEFKYRFSKKNDSRGIKFPLGDITLRNYLDSISFEVSEHFDPDLVGEGLFSQMSVFNSLLMLKPELSATLLKDARLPPTGKNVKWLDFAIHARIEFGLIPLGRVIDRAFRAISISQLLRTGPDGKPDKVEPLSAFRSSSRRLQRNIRKIGRRFVGPIIELSDFSYFGLEFQRRIEGALIALPDDLIASMTDLITLEI